MIPSCDQDSDVAATSSVRCSDVLVVERGVAVEVAELLKRIDRFLTDRNWSEGYFGKVAAGSDLFVGRLRDGKKVHVATVLRAERFLDEQEVASARVVVEEASQVSDA